MLNVIASPGLPTTQTEIQGGMPLSLVLVDGAATLEPYSSTNDTYVGAFYGSNGDNPVVLDAGGTAQTISYCTGFFKVYCAAAVSAGDDLEATATGYATGSTTVVGKALTSCTATEGDYYVMAQLYNN